ncbi:Hsp20/alpha crystallin family protein [Aestuariirhabdus sp. Z084]|uniref:Hsp20/alpha crystallin family protein n=1 Tax=Aestuariirhabdus haliotis TaxID=2918751 RepID=UPI00201B3CC5|nr:Hsp20/alpha crystallin family protein [Aestuariirhabdus haliotis]MCL6414036.1 Hsp20/alpha crystallin family protein [Aestuariirhabdus haliotis]MCL6417969.1 Hsp20/alpha crystallin family protein [Aestuariirhabdus haliotis]
MKWQQALPWNWFSNEQPNSVPVQRQVPQHPLTQLHHEMDRLFGNAFAGFGLSPFEERAFPELKDVMLKPNLDINETPEVYNITVEVAGVDKDDLKIELDGNLLTIKGEKKQEKNEEKDNYHCIERSYGSFQRVLTLPSDADPKRLNANVDKGVLTLSIAKLAEEDEQRRNIEIQSS